MVHPIVSEEQRLLVQVHESLGAATTYAPLSEDELVEELSRLRDEIPGAMADDKYQLMEQYNRQMAMLDGLREARQRSQVDPESPYFAHIRLREGTRERDVCLGKATHLDEDVRIVDWRHAPISRIYYRYRQGQSYTEEIGDRMVDGEVVARRTLTIRGMDLERVDSPEGVFRCELAGKGAWVEEAPQPAQLTGGEGAALRAYAPGEGRHRRLGTDLEGFRQRADKRLPDIAGLIDPTQYDLISRPDSLVVVRGAAGSGKTTVALHRVAWLAYQDAEVDSERSLILVFSPALRNYIAHVLPALGVERVPAQTFHEWATQQQRRHFPRLPRLIREDTPPPVVRLKLNPIMEYVLRAQIERVKGRPTAKQATDDWASAITDAELMYSVFEAHAPGSRTLAEMRQLTSWIQAQICDVLAYLEGDRKNGAQLDSEDLALLLRAFQLRAGPLRQRRKPLRYRHLALDEVQDFSPLEVRILLDCMDPKQRSVTLAGDTQQHLMADTGFTSWGEFLGQLELESAEVDTLKISYRSTEPIMQFAVALLGDLAEDEERAATTRGGPDVELFRFTDHGACVAFLADALRELREAEPLASVALLTPAGDVAELYHAGLQKAELPDLRLIEDQDFVFRPGVEVAEISEAKGLEFDYVILIETSAALFPDDPLYRRRLHVGATRAVHQLWLTCVGTPSPIVEEAIGAVLK